MLRGGVAAKLVALAVLAGALGACSEAQLVVHAAKQVVPTPPAGGGVYKVGKPYQIKGVWYYPAEDWAYDETGIASWYGEDFHGKATANGEVYDMNAMTAAHRTLPMPSFVRVTNLENGRSVVVRVNDRGPFAHSRIIDMSRRSAQLLGFERQGTAKVRVQIMAEESRVLASRGGGGVDATPRPEAAPTVSVATETLPPPGSPQQPAAILASAPSPRPEAAAAGLAPNLQKVDVMPVAPTQVFIQAGSFARYDYAHRLSAKLAPVGPAKVTSAIVNGNEYFRVRIGPLSSVEEADRLIEALIAAGHPDARVIVD